MIRLFQPDVSWCAESVAAQVASGRIGHGEAARRFESLIAASVGESTQCIATTSGTAALMLSILSLALAPRSTILFPAYTMVAGANAARILGFNVRLVDVNSESLCMDPSQIDITDDVSAVIFVDHNGYCGEGLSLVRDQCTRWGIPLIEDACQAIGIPGAGTIGDIGTFSFSVPKLVTTGQGGAVVSRSERLIESAHRWADHGGGWRGDKMHRFLGGNFKFNDVSASLGIPQMERLPELTARRKQIRAWYCDRLSSINPSDGWCVFYRTNDAAGLVVHLKSRDIEASRCYLPMHWHPPYQDGKSYPGAEKVYAETVYLPSHLKITEANVDAVCNAIWEFDH